MRKRRRAVRRAVELECVVECELWGEPVSLLASNLSTDGIWLQTQIALEPEQELVVSFVPPGAEQKVWASARVVRSAELDEEAELSGVALAFTYCSKKHRKLLERSLYGQPPPLPEAPSVRAMFTKIVGDPPPLVIITHGPAPENAIEATVIASRESVPHVIDIARATMQVMDEELREERPRATSASGTMQVNDDELSEGD